MVSYLFILFTVLLFSRTSKRQQKHSESHFPCVLKEWNNKFSSVVEQRQRLVHLLLRLEEWDHCGNFYALNLDNAMHEFCAILNSSLSLWNLTIDNLARDSIHLMVKLVYLKPNSMKRDARLMKISIWKEKMMKEGIQSSKSSAGSLFLPPISL